MLACVFSTATGDIKLVPLHWLYLLMPKKEVKVAATPAKTVVKAFCNAKIKKAVLVNFVGDPRTFVGIPRTLEILQDINVIARKKKIIPPS